MRIALDHDIHYEEEPKLEPCWVCEGEGYLPSGYLCTLCQNSRRYQWRWKLVSLGANLVLRWAQAKDRVYESALQLLEVCPVHKRRAFVSEGYFKDESRFLELARECHARKVDRFQVLAALPLVYLANPQLWPYDDDIPF